MQASSQHNTAPWHRSRSRLFCVKSLLKAFFFFLGKVILRNIKPPIILKKHQETFVRLVSRSIKVKHMLLIV